MISPLVCIVRFMIHLYDEVQPQTVPHLVLATADYSYKSAFVADQEINMLAYMVEVMQQVNFK